MGFFMSLYKDKSDIQVPPCVVALGCFDGVHIGHRAVIKEAVRIATAMGMQSAVWTFSEPPKNFFVPNASPLITDPAQKADYIKSLGVDRFICVDFNADIASLSPKDFFEEIILKELHAKHIVCGFNYTFGAKGAGDTALLSKLCSEKGIELSVIPPVSLDGVAVSSSLIRSCIENGNMEYANKYLGYNYSITSKVIGGQKLARKLGFPTVNLEPKENILLPPNGVYVTRVYFDGSESELFGITNVGTRPTVRADSICAETHIFDFCGDLYEKEVCVEFLHFIRPERLFDSIEELKIQVLSDIESAKAFVRKKIYKIF